jgi:hypothetical protein
VQRLVDDHVEIYFVPPEHNRSLLGILGPPPPELRNLSEDELHDAIETAVEEAIRADWLRGEGE